MSVGEEVGIGSLVGKNSDGTSVCSGISGKISEIKKISDSRYGVKIENDLAKRQGEYLRPFGEENNIRVTDITPEMLISVMKKASVKTRGHQISANDRTVFQRIEDSIWCISRCCGNGLSQYRGICRSVCAETVLPAHECFE